MLKHVWVKTTHLKESMRYFLFLPSSSSLAASPIPLDPFLPHFSAHFVMISSSVGSVHTAAVRFTQTLGVGQLAHRAGLLSFGNVHTVLHSSCTKGGGCSLIKAILTEVWWTLSVLIVYISLKANDMGHYSLYFPEGKQHGTFFSSIYWSSFEKCLLNLLPFVDWRHSYILVLNL